MVEPFTREPEGATPRAPSSTPFAERVGRAFKARRAEIACAALLILMAANLLSAVTRKSITNDEFLHVSAGYYHLIDGDFYLNNEHPPLVKMWAALPLLFVQPEEPTPASATMFPKQEGFWHFNREKFRAIAFWTRAAMLPLTLALGALVFIYTRKLFNARAALLAVALFSFEPTLLAHGRIVHTDVPAALVYLLFFFALHAYIKVRTWHRALLLGAACGAALVTKFSMIVLLPVLACAFVFVMWKSGDERGGRRRAFLLLHAALAVSVILFVVNAAYFFKSPAVETYDMEWLARNAGARLDELLTGFRALSQVVPSYFLYGVYSLSLHNWYGHTASLLGQYGTTGWWYYFPVAFALKTSLPFLLLSVASLGWSAWRLAFKKDVRFLALIIPLAVYMILSMTSRINIGVRHFLPAFPFLLILSGALLDRLLEVKRRRALVVACVVLTLGWSCVEAWRAYPDYVPYMNQLASKHPRWWYLSDSNVEWGDDAQALAAYLKARGETKVSGMFIGAGSPTDDGIEFVSLMGPRGLEAPRTRYVAVGAGFLNGSTVPNGEPGSGRANEDERLNFFARYRARRPEAIIGHSIYVYRAEDVLTLGEVNR